MPISNSTGGKMELATVILLSIILGALTYKLAIYFLEKRALILNEAGQIDLEIINNYNLENDNKYFEYYGQGSRQKVLGRENNLIVVNFNNRDQILASNLRRV